VRSGTDSKPVSSHLDLIWKKGKAILFNLFYGGIYPTQEGRTLAAALTPKGPLFNKDTLGFKVHHMNFGDHQHSDHRRECN
jgi:hypothetical protein